MPKLITWNIQSARTAGGGADPRQLIAALDRFSGFDVLCLQEVACGMPAPDGSPCGDQFADLAACLPGYSASACFALDTLAPGGTRARLGTAVFSRYPVLQVLRHSLPWPADPEVMSMPRAALEVTLDTPGGLLRVASVHLEYFSQRQRGAQVDRLRELHREAVLHAARPRPGGPAAGAFAAVPRAAPAVFMGDFNMLPDSPEHARLLAPFTDGTPALRDACAWRSRAGAMRPPSGCMPPGRAPACPLPLTSPSSAATSPPACATCGSTPRPAAPTTRPCCSNWARRAGGAAHGRAAGTPAVERLE